MKRTVETPAGEVSFGIDGNRSSTVLVLAHGAGAGMDHPFMSAVAEGISAAGPRVARFNFSYVERGRKAPDRQAVLEDTYEAIVEHIRRELRPERLFLGGKSMGGRIATYMPARGVICDGLVMLGYPLHPPGRPDRIRDQHLYELKTPVLFVEGTRDPFCPLDRLEAVRERLQTPSTLAVIEDGDHSFKVRKSSGRDPADALEEITSAVALWIATCSKDEKD